MDGWTDRRTKMQMDGQKDGRAVGRREHRRTNRQDGRLIAGGWADGRANRLTDRQAQTGPMIQSPLQGVLIVFLNR
jgi:hypothetical protein